MEEYFLLFSRTTSEEEYNAYLDYWDQALSSGGASIGPCKVFEQKRGQINLSCLENNFQQFVKINPEVNHVKPRFHCSQTHAHRDYSRFSNRILVTQEGQSFGCETQTLEEFLSSTEGNLNHGALTYAQFKGKDLTVWVPDYLCQQSMYLGIPVDSKDNFASLAVFLSAPLSDDGILHDQCRPRVASDPDPIYFSKIKENSKEIIKYSVGAVETATQLVSYYTGEKIIDGQYKSSPPVPDGAAPSSITAEDAMDVIRSAGKP